MARATGQPKPWKERRATIHRTWLTPLFAVEWGCEKISYWMGRWAFLDLLEYVGKLGLIGALARLAMEDPRKASRN
jgi:hypothetical protein